MVGYESVNVALQSRLQGATRFPQSSRCSATLSMWTSNTRYSWCPDATYTLHLSNEPAICDLCGPPSTVCQSHRRPIVRLIERILQKLDVSRLKCSKRRLEVRVSQSNNRWRHLFVILWPWWPARHIDHYNKFDTSVREPSVGGQALVNSLQEPKVLVDGLVGLSNLEDVEAGVEEEGKLQLFILVGWKE
jgi:hypothetical protein